MKPHDWHTLLAFGFLAGALSVFDKRMALWAITAASAVVVVKHSGTFTSFLNNSVAPSKKGGK